MVKQSMKIQYLYQSGFCVEINNLLFIFDYMEGHVDLGGKSTLVFSSHSHYDHYNPIIFDWQKENQDIKYILSDDIPILHPKSNIYRMSPYEEIHVEGVKIKAYGSTDLGVSFVIKWAGITLFHAGDLNWWHWWEDTPQEIHRAEIEFKNEIAKIKGEVVDVAFFPLDPRLEHTYSLGADYFINEIAPKFLIPMHFGRDYKASGQYATEMEDSHTRIVVFTEQQQKILLEI